MAQLSHEDLDCYLWYCRREVTNMLITDARYDEREYTHMECDCAPGLGVSHCHMCTKMFDKEVEWPCGISESMRG